MSEARKLEELTKPAAPQAEIPIGAELHEAIAATNTATELKPRRRHAARGRSFAVKLAALFALGFVAFVAGVAAAAAVVLGMLDSSWVKDTMKGLKETATHLMQLVQ